MKSEDYIHFIEDAAKNPAKYGLRECCLCGREVIFAIGVWMPDSKDTKTLNRLKAPPGKLRTIVYALCEECANRGQEAVDLMEKEALAAADRGDSDFTENVVR